MSCPITYRHPEFLGITREDGAVAVRVKPNSYEKAVKEYPKNHLLEEPVKWASANLYLLKGFSRTSEEKGVEHVLNRHSVPDF